MVTKIVTRVIGRRSMSPPALTNRKWRPNVEDDWASTACGTLLASVAVAMGTLLLVSDDSPKSETENSAIPRRPALKGALERVGYNVVRADDAVGALARLAQRLPDLIVVAGAVPDMDLVDLCTALRQDPGAEQIPFVLVAEAAGRIGRAASKIGADLVFPPTVGPVEIADRLQRLF
jgi:CheY-like chemotaxis protein